MIFTHPVCLGSSLLGAFAYSVYLNGKKAVRFSRIYMLLILAMALRFVPRFSAQIKIISNAQKCVGRDVSTGSILQKIRCGMCILSIMVTWVPENAIETADSMKNRGYGLPGRTAFSIYRFDQRDERALLFILPCAAYIIAGYFTEGLYFRYYPTIKGLWASPYAISIFAVYLALCAWPIIVNKKEDLI